MRQKFLGNLIFLILANLLVKPFWILGIDRYVQNQSGPILYGAYFAVFNFTFLFHIVLDAGINNFNNTEASRDNNFIAAYASAMLNIKVLFSLVYVAITVGLAWFTAFDGLQYKMLYWLMLNLILLNFVLYFRSNIAAMQWYRLDSVLSITDRLLAIIFCSVLIYFHPWGRTIDVMHFIYAQTLALVITLLIAMVVSFSKSNVFNYSLDFSLMKKLLKRSYPFAIIGILMTLYYRLDGVMIEQMLPIDGKEQAGIYAASYRLFDATNMIAYLFATLLLPMFSVMIAKRENVEDLTKTAAKLLFAGSVFVAILSFFYSEQWMPMLYHQADSYWINIFKLLMITFIAVSMTYVYGTLLTAGGHLQLFNILAFLGLVINFSLNLFLIPHYKAIGATWATLITQFFIASMQMYWVYRKYHFKVVIKDTFKLMTYAALLIVFSLLCLHFHLPFIPVAVMISLMALVLFFILKIIPLNAYQLFIKKEQ